MKKKLLKKALVFGTAAAAAGVAAKKAYENSKKRQEEEFESAADVTMENRSYEGQKAYFVGGGLGSMAGAAYLIRDCKFPGEQITIYEGMHILGGSNDGIGTPEGGFVCRGGRMLNEETYENYWELSFHSFH